jgi:hypothetical protein
MARRCRHLISLAVTLSLASTLTSTLGGCATTRSPGLRVLGVHEEPRHEVVFVEVTNPARQPMRLTKLEYRFAAGRTTVAQGELELAREVPAGEAVVVEVPIDPHGSQGGRGSHDRIGAAAGEEPLTLRGKLTAVTDQIVRIFEVSAEVAPGTR